MSTSPSFGARAYGVSCFVGPRSLKAAQLFGRPHIGRAIIVRKILEALQA
jgi:hypothetical protein